MVTPEQFLQEWWPAVVGIVLAVAKIANVATKHWPQWSARLRWLGFLVEVLDLIRIPEVKRRDQEDKTSTGPARARRRKLKP